MCMCLKYGIKMKGLGETRADRGDEDSSHKGPGTFLLWGALLITAPLLAVISSADADSCFPGSDHLVSPVCNSAWLGALIPVQIVHY